MMLRLAYHALEIAALFLVAALFWLAASGCAHLPAAPTSCDTDADCSDKFGGSY